MRCVSSSGTRFAGGSRDYFRILKSGCKVEELQHHSAERLERAIAIKMVVGWRIQLMVRLGREVPGAARRE